MGAVTDTSRASYDVIRRSGQQGTQCERILAFIRARGGDWSIGELAKAMGLEKSVVSARLNFLRSENKLELRQARKDRVSGVTVRPVGLPMTQGELFQ